MRAKCLGYAGLAGALLVGTVVVPGSAGCKHNPPPPAATPASTPGAAAPPAACTTPEPLKIVLTASARLNLGEKGEALATVVRLYQLKGVSKLIGVGFDDLMDHDKEALGEDFLGVQEVTINPGERQEPPIVRKPDAGFLLAVALFRRPAGTTWKAIKRLNPPDPQFCQPPAKGTRVVDGTVRLALDENRIELR
jgi:type VI secretion system VasD/TssJ family lipoprotein